MKTRHSNETGEARAVAADRLTTFVDAVIAIALTLLALDLPAPTGDTTDAMLSSALAHGKEYLAFALSFTVIAAHWHAHHEIFRYVGSLSGRLTSLTLAWLFMQVLMPFATRLLTADGAFPPRFSFYALVQVLASATFALIIREIRREHLHRSDVTPPEFAQSLVRSICLAAVFAVSVPVSSLIGGTGAYLCWLTAPVVLAVARRVQSRAVQ
ncbi:TMEM175 family protein [Amycolatopsis sp. FBCC-B4732]|uniref:TMEM175 family protein n=1 Tax=Amycolatopsis sp. FBCC-B4732 TaxID=3079339 RepID=UPI001FF43D55|nr:TMEM175 family protein [Amycolatopsis sp. FBCC-B4732]UOX85861.1 TMEM175 family protein [Amycolatopsis sp. FBCC-B4732]